MKVIMNFFDFRTIEKQRKIETELQLGVSVKFFLWNQVIITVIVVSNLRNQKPSFRLEVLNLIDVRETRQTDKKKALFKHIWQQRNNQAKKRYSSSSLYER